MLAIYKSSIRKYHYLMTNDVYNYFLEGKCKVNLRGPGSCALHQASERGLLFSFSTSPVDAERHLSSSVIMHYGYSLFLWMVLYTEICQRIPSGELIVSTSSTYSQGYFSLQRLRTKL